MLADGWRDHCTWQWIRAAACRTRGCSIFGRMLGSAAKPRASVLSRPPAASQTVRSVLQSHLRGPWQGALLAGRQTHGSEPPSEPPSARNAARQAAAVRGQRGAGAQDYFCGAGVGPAAVTMRYSADWLASVRRRVAGGPPQRWLRAVAGHAALGESFAHRPSIC